MKHYKFLIITLVLAMVTGSAVPVYNTLVTHPAMIRLMLQNTEQSAVKAAHLIVEDAFDLDSSTFLKPLSVGQIQSIQRLKRQYSMTRIKVFAPSGRIIFSTRHQDIGEINRKDYFHQQVARGETVHKLVNKEGRTMEGATVSRDVAEVYVPVMSENIFAGAFEFYFDVTEQKSAITSLSRSSFKFLFVVTFCLLFLFAVVGARMRQMIKKQQQAEQEVLKLAYSDSLTGLPNRHLFMNRLEQALSRGRRINRNVALLYMDIDHFKSVNDSLGHAQGDILLKAVAGRMNEQVRKSDTLSRIGGDEFVFLATDLQRPEDAVTIAKSLLEMFKSPFVIDQHELFISPSIGIAIHPGDGDTPGLLLKHADIAMYSAKRKGRNTYVCFSREMDRKVRQQHELETCMRNALLNGQFSLVYQPQIDLRTGMIVGAEALLRWQHPEKGLIPPDQFIPLAEKSGLIGPIGEWVLAEACRQNAAWLQMGDAPLRVAVNLSAYQLKQGDFPGTVKRILAETGMPPDLLELELTESQAMEDTTTNICTLSALSDLGIQLSIDDFGTGYSSLSYLQDLPIDHIKIDRSFIGLLPEGNRSGVIVDAMIAMARTLGLTVIAEGVENQSQMEFLKSRNCDIIQGYYTGRPLPADEFSGLLRKAG